jgi:hypothetical protein
VLDSLRADIDSLRRSQAVAPARVEIVHVNGPPSSTQAPVAEGFTKVVTAPQQQQVRTNKWSQYVGDSPVLNRDKGSAAGSAATVNAAPRTVQQIESFDVVEPKPAPTPKAQASVTPKPAAASVSRPKPAKPTPQIQEVQPVPKQSTLDELMRVRLPYSHNTDLQNWFLTFKQDRAEYPQPGKDVSFILPRNRLLVPSYIQIPMVFIGLKSCCKRTALMSGSLKKRA